MLCKEVQDYIASAKGLPFFYLIGDAEYASVLDELKENGISVVRMSDFCFKDDKFPSIDELIDNFRTSDVDYRDNKFVVIGLGEFLAIKGSAYADKELRRLKSTTLGTARVILLLRGVSHQASRIIEEDSRMKAQKRAYIAADTVTQVSILNTAPESGMVKNVGIKYLIRSFEDGACGSVSAATSLDLTNSMLQVTSLLDAYGILNATIKGFNLDNEIGTNEQWSRMLKEIKDTGKNMPALFEKYGIDEGIFDNLHEAITGLEFKNWLAFVYCKWNQEQISNLYLRHVVEKTVHFEDFKDNILTMITAIPHTDPVFRKMYDSRKRLVREFPSEDVAVFLKANEVDPEEAIYRFTDNTSYERKAIVKWIAHHGISDAIEYVYPALAAYLKKYNFTCPVLAPELTAYMDAYKKQKITNRVEPDFLKIVEDYASRYLYAQLPTRDSAIQAIQDKKNAYLYWIDALGVEYLSYIESLAKKKGLSMRVDITRCDLPTITKVNKQFYDNWPGDMKFKEKDLDEIKHKEEGGYLFTNDEDPIHIPAELAVIEKAINTAAIELTMHRCQSFVLASDHGASRLAVLNKQEIPYDTDTKGEHSGRCCVLFEGCDVPFKVEENNYIVLSDYGRFKKSRAANVEVHGGATLEEVVVPVITLTLKKNAGIKIQVVQPDKIQLDRRKGVTLQLYISDTNSNNISIMLNDKPYAGTSNDGKHFVFALSDIKRAKDYTVDVFDAEDLIGTIKFTVKGKTATVNDDFDSLF